MSDEKKYSDIKTTMALFIFMNMIWREYV